eukprot:CAMPEP_0168409216 /NCGR_PEP_ID=MMETSP0228-20121227/27070_1 /TAXON_ID=133427 /ORGANISM="Protoceratium reticulatum, Strain CCCM 535 (=CCMP 1889)" /LENGTH=307 /DNA_ID=CAMNT_0008422923 /DNA_START=62 /DNA_END=985 /DNA_ORIENTATION=+
MEEPCVAARGLLPAQSALAARACARLVWAAPHAATAGRINSLSPPYSPHSRCAAVLVLLFTCGVVSANRLPPGGLPAVAVAMQIWHLLAVVWLTILAWLILNDPRARPAAHAGHGAGRANLTQCRHGCIYALAPRTKHCRQCDKCVDGFDHHCLWLNTCVGAKNYRPWVVFVMLLFLWVVVGSGISWVALVRALPVPSKHLAVGHRPLAFVTALGTFTTAGWLLALLGLHAYLTCRGLTTLEWIKGRGAHEAQAAGPRDEELPALPFSRGASDEAAAGIFLSRVDTLDEDGEGCWATVSHDLEGHMA